MLTIRKIAPESEPFEDSPKRKSELFEDQGKTRVDSDTLVASAESCLSSNVTIPLAGGGFCIR